MNIKPSKRAERRAHYVRLKNNRKTYYRNHNYSKDERQLGILTRTPCLCSCHGCGNPRKHFKEKTLQELKNELSYMETNYE